MTINDEKDLLKDAFLYNAGGNINWCGYYVSQYGGFSKSVSITAIGSTYDWATPLHSMVLNTLSPITETCTPHK